VEACVILLFLCFIPSHVKAEQINDFSATYAIQKEGTVQVEERIQYDFGTADRHGIYRTIPLTKTNTDGQKFRLSLSDVQVVDQNGKPYGMTKTENDDTVTLRIGDANTTITGVHVYRLLYSISGALTYFSDHDELYWNVTGNEWSVPINQVRSTVTFPQMLAASDVKLTCYTGVSGSTSQSCNTSFQNNTATITAASLGSDEGLTVVVSFPKNIVATLEPELVVVKQPNLIKKIIGTVVTVCVVLAILLWYLGLPVWIIIHWLRHGRDPKPTIGVASAWFEAPKTQKGRLLTPGEAGTLIDEKVDMKEITATIVDLARRGYMKIVEKKKNDFYLTKLKEFSADKTLQSHELTLLAGLFSKKDEVRIKDADLISAVTTMTSNLYTAVVTEKYFDRNPNTTRIIFYVIAGVALFTGNFFLAVVAFIFGRVMPKKTQLGTDAAAVAKSLKNFLSSQEKWLAGIAQNQLMFEKLLPYAVAFGVEKIWADRFKDIAMKNPAWYQGYGNYTFTSLYLMNAIASTHSNVVSAATPTRSSSGFSSGFSGGSSGGGGGGGGGGSW
jgi:uncharacterized membrane protein